MRPFEIVTAFVITVGIAAGLVCCAGNNESGSSAPLSPEQKKTLRLAAVTAETQSDVTMEKAALDRIVQHVRDDIKAQSPDIFASPAVPGAAPPLTMKLFFMRYEGGDLGARFVRPSGGVIRIDADVLFIDAGGKIVARSSVTTQFGSGGYSGLTTDISNVEGDFERTVAALIR